MTETFYVARRSKRLAPWLWGAAGLVVLGTLIGPRDQPDATPAPLADVSADNDQLTAIEEADAIREALAAEVAANADSELNAASRRANRVEALLAAGGSVPPPTADPSVTSVEMTVDRIVDGDTLVTVDGYTIRLIGIDSPEQGACGTDESAAALRDLVEGETVAVTNPASVDDVDKYGRILRYVDSPNGDVGEALLGQGLAVARYDYLDGYQWHPNQDAYRALDAATAHICGTTMENDPTQILAIAAPAPVAPVGLVDVPEEEPAPATDPWNMPGPDLDCADIGHKVYITGTDYHRLDSDGDGVGCESYG